VENVFLARGLPGAILADEYFAQMCRKHALALTLVPGEEAGLVFDADQGGN
jgi:hypothetical protein